MRRNLFNKYPLQIWLALGFLILLLTFGYFSARANVGFDTDLKSWEKEEQLLVQRLQTDSESMNKWLDSFKFDSPARMQVEEKLKSDNFKEVPKEPLDVSEIDSWVHQETGLSINLVFAKDDCLFFHQVLWGPAEREKVNPKPIVTSGWGFMEKTRKGLSWGSLIVYLISLTCLGFRKSIKARQWFSLLMVASSLTGCCCSLVNPRYSITWQGVFSNESLLAGAIMLLLAIVYLACSYPKQKLQLDLKSLILVVSFAAVLSALGIVGLVTLGTFAVGTGVFLFANQYFDLAELQN